MAQSPAATAPTVRASTLPDKIPNPARTRITPPIRWIQNQAVTFNVENTRHEGYLDVARLFRRRGERSRRPVRADDVDIAMRGDRSGPGRHLGSRR